MPDTLARLAQLALVSDERTILQAALRATARGVHAPLAQVLERSPDGETLVVRASRGWGRADGSRRDLPAGARSQAGFTLDVDEPVLLEDAAAEDRFEVAEAARGRDVGSGVTCVIAGVGAPFGVLAVHSPRVRAFGPDDVDRAHRIADIVALAVARVRSEHRVTELAEVRGRLVMETVAAEERERKRLAEALHDGAMQNVVTAGFDLDVLIAGGGDDGDGERVRRARKAIGDALRQLRSTVQDLHPIVLEAAGLTVALERLCAEHDERSQAEFVLDLHREAEGPHDRLVFELARELVGNAVRHAKATQIEVAVGLEDGQLALTVADDGRGMRPGSRAAALRAGHIGLASSAERLELAGGRLDIDSAPGKGTTVTARLPAAAPDAA
jgi:signal transduction histidine kinase